MGGRKKRYIERHAYCEKHEDEQEFEEIGGMRREAGHPVRTEKKIARAFVNIQVVAQACKYPIPTW